MLLTLLNNLINFVYPFATYWKLKSYEWRFWSIELNHKPANVSMPFSISSS